MVAIITVLSAMAAIGLTRSRERTTMRQEVIRVRSAIERSRTLAVQAGSRLGTPRLVLDPATCRAAPSGDVNNLWVVVNPGTQEVWVPTTLQPNPATDITTAFCERLQLGQGQLGYDGVLNLGIGAGNTFAFSSSGRIIGDGAPPPGTGVHIIATNPNDARRYGFRVLPSGIVCDSTNIAPVAGVPPCDAD